MTYPIEGKKVIFQRRVVKKIYDVALNINRLVRYFEACLLLNLHTLCDEYTFYAHEKSETKKSSIRHSQKVVSADTFS